MGASLPSSSLAAVVREFGKPIDVSEVEAPAELEPGSLLVQIEAASMCGSDVHLWEGAMGKTFNPKLPCILGHEMVGRIVGFGDGARRDSMDQDLVPGDRVVFTHAPCRRCAQCVGNRNPLLCTNKQFYQAVGCEDYPYLTGGFSQYCYVFPNSGRVRVPDAVKSTWASASSCAMRTVTQGIRRGGGVGMGDTVVIQGSGPLGLFATAIASVEKPRRLIFIGAPRNRLDVALEFGADEVISIEDFDTPEARLDQVLALTDGHGADLVLEVSGAAGAFREGIALSATGGRYVVIGQVGGDLTPVPAYELVVKQLNVSGVWSAEIDAYHLALLFLERHADRFDWDRVISNHYPLERINDAIASMRAHQEIKPMILPNGTLN